MGRNPQSPLSNPVSDQNPEEVLDEHKYTKRHLQKAQ